VEDVPETREAFALLLGADGADVVATGLGCEAVEVARVRPFDVLITDLALPDIPGEVLIREILASAVRRPQVVVVITGSTEPHLTRASEAGADVVLTKPLEWAALLASLPAPARPDAA
jgi:DNA-binding response OmpR family regulator